MTCRMVPVILVIAALAGGYPADAGFHGPSEAAAQEPNQSMRVSTFAARVEKVERSTRGLIVLGQDGIRQAITVAPDVPLYDELAEGDVIVVDYIEAVVVALKPGASLTVVEDTTAAARAGAAEPTAAADPAGTPGPLVRIDQQVKLVVTIDSVDPAARTVVYHGKDNRRSLRAVQDPRLLEGLRAGDVVEITMTRGRAVSVTRAPPE